MPIPRLVLVTPVIAALAACGPTTKLTAVWRTPDTIGPRFQKILVVAQAPSPSQRRSVETALVRNIPRGVPSYTVLGDARRQGRRTRPRQGFERRLRRGRGRAARRRRSQVNYVPGTAYWGPAPYGSLWGYWAYGWGMAYDPGYMKTENVVTLESNVYAVANEKLIWSSRSESVSPVSVDSLMDDLVAATVREMKKQRVL